MWSLLLLKLVTLTALFLVLLLMVLTPGTKMRTAGPPKQWAVLVAGSKGWTDYRHQAGVCHAYKVLTERGLPEQNIIVLMYDDIANNSHNPTPGVVVNYVGGPDVYEGVRIDYRRGAVTPDTFLSVLRGDARGASSAGGSGRVLDSGPDDHVFLFFADHGSTGFLSFPDDVLDWRAFNRVISELRLRGRFASLLVYVEACKSGSLFESQLGPAGGVLAMTASNSSENSFACCWDDARNTFLGDEFSLAWLLLASSGPRGQALNRQLAGTMAAVNKTVSLYGDLRLGRLLVGQFQGPAGGSQAGGRLAGQQGSVVPANEVPLATCLRSGTDEEDRLACRQKNLEEQGMVDKTYDSIREAVEQDGGWLGTETADDDECYVSAVEHYHTTCHNLAHSQYAFARAGELKKMCQTASSRRIKRAIDKVCGGKRKQVLS